MPLIEPITESHSYQQYLDDISAQNSYQLDKCFACGLPAVWLYMKAIGLEAEYFNILDRSKDRSFLFKELFYLLMLTSTDINYFPKPPNGLLNLEIAPAVLDAQVELQKPDFELAFAFTREQLAVILKQIVLANKMVRLGNKKNAVGIMFKNNKYSVYDGVNSSALEFDNLDSCLDIIMRSEPVYICSRAISGLKVQSAPSDLEIFKQLCAKNTPEQLQATLYAAVQAGLVEQVKYLHTLDSVKFNHLYGGGISLLDLKKLTPAMLTLLLKYPELQNMQHREDVHVVANTPVILSKKL